MIDRLKAELAANGIVYFVVKVRPQASATALKGVLADETLKIDLAAVPENGKANAELMKFLAKEFSVSASSIEIVSGKTDRKKIIRVRVRQP